MQRTNRWQSHDALSSVHLAERGGTSCCCCCSSYFLVTVAELCRNELVHCRNFHLVATNCAAASKQIKDGETVHLRYLHCCHLVWPHSHLQRACATRRKTSPARAVLRCSKFASYHVSLFQKCVVFINIYFRFCYNTTHVRDSLFKYKKMETANHSECLVTRDV